MNTIDDDDDDDGVGNISKDLINEDVMKDGRWRQCWGYSKMKNSTIRFFIDTHQWPIIKIQAIYFKQNIFTRIQFQILGLICRCSWLKPIKLHRKIPLVIVEGISV